MKMKGGGDRSHDQFVVIMTQGIVVGLCWMLSAAGVAASPPSMGDWNFEWGPAWSVQGNFAKGKDISGAAVFGVEAGVAVSDETRTAQRISIVPAARLLRVHEVVPLVADPGTEFDLEGAAASRRDRAYYLIGSQALARQKGVYEADRGYLFRLPADAAFRPQPGRVSRIDFRSILAADTDLAPYLNLPATANGLDVEGLAERDGRLFVGLRAPERDGHATVLEVETELLFAEKPAPLTHHQLPLGPGRGIRSLTALDRDHGFLLIAGPSGGPESGRSAEGDKYELWHWPGPGSAPATRLGRIDPVPGEPDAKAEALFVYAQSEDTIDGLILHDGVKNGAPHGFRLTRTAHR